MNRYIIYEKSIHYAVNFMERYLDKYPTKEHANALKDFRDLSNLLIENLGQPITLNIIRDKYKK